MNVPDDLSSLEIPDTQLDERGLDPDLCRVSSMNLILDLFMHPVTNSLLNNDAHICIYVKPLFGKSVTHLEMHDRIETYIRKYMELKQKYATINTDFGGAGYDQAIAEYRYTLLPILGV